MAQQRVAGGSHQLLAAFVVEVVDGVDGYVIVEALCPQSRHVQPAADALYRAEPDVA